MSLTGRDPMSDVQGEGWGWGDLSSNVQYIMGDGHMGPHRQTELQINITGNITFPQLCWRAVKMWEYKILFIQRVCIRIYSVRC